MPKSADPEPATATATATTAAIATATIADIATATRAAPTTTTTTSTASTATTASIAATVTTATATATTAASATTAATTVVPVATNTTAAASQLARDVHVFYYPWYGAPAHDGAWRHWNHERMPHWDPKVAKRWPRDRHVPPDDLGSTYYPSLGPYSSRDPAVIDAHMRQIARSGAGVLAVSWYPPGTEDGAQASAGQAAQTSDGLVPTLLDAAHAHGLQLTLHIEPYVNRSADSVARDLKYIVATYGAYPALHRHEGRRGSDRTGREGLPLLYVYDSYLIGDEAWAAVLRPGGARSVRGTPHDAVVLGLLCEQKHQRSLLAAGFDGAYTYFASRRFTYGADWTRWAALGAWARRHGLLFAPSAGPGYDDTRVRPWNGANTQPRRGGRYYAEALAAAAAAGAPLVSITSFNEWHEGTQIEAAAPRRGHGDASSPSYPDYEAEGGPNAYLDLTARWVRGRIEGAGGS